MRAKPRIHRGPDGWRVTKPGYGFNADETTGPFASFRAAVESLQSKTASAGPDIQRTRTPCAQDYRRWGHEQFPLEIR